jgi:hypothetical protein
MSAALLAGITGLALLDALNPATILSVTLILLATPRRPGLTALSAVTGAALTVFTVGSVLYLSAGAAAGAVDGVITALRFTAFGAAAVSLAVAGVRRLSDRPRRPIELPPWFSPATALPFGVLITAADLPNAFPYFIAIERLVDAGVPGWQGRPGGDPPHGRGRGRRNHPVLVGLNPEAVHRDRLHRDGWGEGLRARPAAHRHGIRLTQLHAEPLTQGHVEHGDPDVKAFLGTSRANSVIMPVKWSRLGRHPRPSARPSLRSPTRAPLRRPVAPERDRIGLRALPPVCQEFRPRAHRAAGRDGGFVSTDNSTAPTIESPSAGRTHTPWAAYAAVVVPVVIVLGAVAMQPWMPLSDLMRDSQVVAVARGDANAAYGLLSNLGILVMALASGGALIGRLALRGAPGPVRSLLAWSALLSLAVALDDLLLLHETLAFAAWAGALVGAVYGLAFLSYYLRFRATIRRDLGAGLLALAVAALGFSLVVDGLMEPATQSSILLEDGAKLLGFVAWSAFVLRAAVLALRSRASAPGGDARAHGAGPRLRTAVPRRPLSRRVPGTARRP